MSTSLNDKEIIVILEGLGVVLGFAKDALEKEKPGSPSYKAVQHQISHCISASNWLKNYNNEEHQPLVINEYELNLMYGALEFLLNDSDDVLKTVPIVSVDYIGTVNTINLMKTAKEKIIALMAEIGCKPVEA